MLLKMKHILRNLLWESILFSSLDEELNMDLISNPSIESRDTE